MKASTPVALLALLLSGLLALASCVSLGPLVVDRSARAPDLPGFGQLDWPITTSSPEARRWFNHGVLQAYAFNEAEAQRSFKAALAIDPECAMCAWGMAWQLGPNINAVERDSASEARRYAQLAGQLSTRPQAPATPLERTLVEAMQARYAEASDPARRAFDAASRAAVCGSGGGSKPADPLDLVYADRMREAVARFPADPNVLSLYAEAEMVATRGDWWNERNGRPQGRIGELVDQLEKALARHAAHTGLNHYLIHAADAPAAATRALPAAERLGRLAPASPHLVHMPSHIHVRVGRYGDAVAVNTAAVAAQARLDDRVKAAGFKQSKNWNGHNQHFLWFAALMQGRAELAMSTARRIAERAAQGIGDRAAYLRGLPVYTLARFERWSELLAETADPASAARYPGFFEHGRGLALLHSGKAAQATALLAGLEALLAAERAALAKDAKRGRQKADALAVLHGELKAELALARGEVDAAIEAQRAAVAAEKSINEGEPPGLAAGSVQALGRLLLRAGRAKDAEAEFRADLQAQPDNGWALRGLQHALAAQGRRAEAAQVLEAWQRSWREADPALKPA